MVGKSGVNAAGRAEGGGVEYDGDENANIGGADGK